MKYSAIRKIDISNGPYIGVSLFLQGCNFHCKNCFNQVTWPLDGGLEFTPEIEETFMNLIEQEGIMRVSILGGEPMIQAKELSTLLEKIKKIYPDKKIWLWTGYYINELVEPDQKKVIGLCDYIVDGRYVDDLKNKDLRFKGSTNQTIWTKDSEGNLIKSKYS